MSFRGAGSSLYAKLSVEGLQKRGNRGKDPSADIRGKQDLLVRKAYRQEQVQV